MLLQDEFLLLVKQLLEEDFAGKSLDPIQALSIKTTAYEIFDENFDLEKIYFRLLEFLENNELSHLQPSLDTFYNEKII